jgi:hypothetical protein
MTTCDSPRLFAVACLAACAALGAATPARAQAEDQATARALFNEARALMAQRHYREACPKLEAASKLYSGSGLLLNLADCFEHLGRTASAWTEFGEAASTADRTGRANDKAEAERRQAALEPKLSKLAIQVTAATSGLVVNRDGTELSRGAWGTAVPVDPGDHAVSADAPGRTPWSTSVSVTQAGKTFTVQVPELEAAATAPATATATTAAPTPSGTSDQPLVVSAPDAAPAPYWTGRRLAGFALTGAGVLGMGVGGVLGLAAKSKYTTAQGESGAPRHDDSASAVSTGNVATVVVAAGAVLAAGGLVVWLTAPNAAAQVGIDGTRLLVRGSF